MEIKIMEKLRKSMDNDDDILELLIDLSEEKQHNQLWIMLLHMCPDRPPPAAEPRDPSQAGKSVTRVSSFSI
jgi:hypothetical protein